MPDNAPADPRIEVAHFHWAGLDFLVDQDGTPVFIEANRASHMLGEYLHFFGDDRPFELTAAIMSRAAGPPCLLWRRCDPAPDADEDACFIGRHLERHLSRPAIVCNVEDNQEPRDELTARDGRRVRPGSIFRWWYGLPWSYERSGVTVINPNAVWLAVRDKLSCAATLSQATNFRVPRSFNVDSAADVRRLLAEHGAVFQSGYVVKPRVGWGGYDVQVADPGEEPREISGNCLLSERIWPRQYEGRFWEARMFVMGGVCLGGLKHTSRRPLTNYWQGAIPERLDDATTALLASAALESVRLLDEEAARLHALPEPPCSVLTDVNYEGRGNRTTAQRGL
jgi:hypothetical protein